VIEAAGEVFGHQFGGLFSEDVQLVEGDLFADYFEPDQIFTLRTKPAFGRGSLMDLNFEALEVVGLKPAASAKLLFSAAGEFSIEDFWNATEGVAPTLVLLETDAGMVAGGVAAVPWPIEDDAEDPTMTSFIFSLGANPVRYDLIQPGGAIGADGVGFGFGRHYELDAMADGTCTAREGRSGSDYGLTNGACLFGASCTKVPMARIEVWML
jgi:hypothetical protein